eukprot:363796-Chlamydomonas_euryale.AAC.3
MAAKVGPPTWEYWSEYWLGVLGLMAKQSLPGRRVQNHQCDRRPGRGYWSYDGVSEFTRHRVQHHHDLFVLRAPDKRQEVLLAASALPSVAAPSTGPGVRMSRAPWPRRSRRCSPPLHEGVARRLCVVAVSLRLFLSWCVQHRHTLCGSAPCIVTL